MKTRIKICGITSLNDADLAVKAGVDAIGLVFYRNSPRHVEPEQARHIMDALPPFITTVGLFVDADEAAIRQVLEQAPVDLLQFHGHESAGFCQSFGKPYLKAVRVREETDLHDLCKVYRSASGLLLDSYKKGVPGGTGASFNWNLIPADLALPIVLAGGLNAGNVADAINRVKPYAVDVSSGVEVAPGTKDKREVEAFVRAVSDANRHKAL
jgi:phosphoribosylanthranilate isomerase